MLLLSEFEFRLFVEPAGFCFPVHRNSRKYSCGSEFFSLPKTANLCYTTFITGYKMKAEIKKIIVDESSPLFETRGMFTKEFPSDLRQLKFFTGIIMQKVPGEIKGRVLLEKQISELIKNALKHGNKQDKRKKVRVHYAFTPEKAHLIIADEGTGFTELEAWNEFYRKQRQCYLEENYDEMSQFASFRSSAGTQEAEDRGQTLFQAVEFWNGGMVFNSKRNCLAVLKRYPRKNPGIALNQPV